MPRKRKATFRDIPDYYGVTRVENYGWLYTLSQNLTAEDKQALSEKFSNLEFFRVKSEYAPELNRSSILIRDRVKR